MNYTIFVKDPLRDHPYPATPNCAGQMIAFDGKCSKEQAVHIARLAAQSWKSVDLFKGKYLGHLVEGWQL